MFRLSHADNNHNMLDQMFVLTFWLHWTAQSVDLLLACYVANATCTVIVVVATLIFITVLLTCIVSCPLITTGADSSCGNIAFPTNSSL